MLTDRYGLTVSTSSPTARDAYVAGYDLLFALWSGAEGAFARATAEDPHFALAHLGTAQVAAAMGEFAKMQSALAAARSMSAGLSRREASHLAFFELMLTGQSDTAISAAEMHLAEWPRDAAVMNHHGPILGLVSLSGRRGVKREQAAIMARFAHHYPDDGWYLAHHAMALCEIGRRDEALALAQRSLDINPRNAVAAHSRGHVAYEDGDDHGARAFLATWLPSYPRSGLLHGHLCWHLAIAELNAGNGDAAFRTYAAFVAPGAHQGVFRSKVYDAIQFLWRWELAGNARDAGSWQALDAFAHAMMPKPGHAFSDFHILLADAVAGDHAALTMRLEEMDALTRAGRYPGEGVVQQIARGLAAYACEDYEGAITMLVPLLPQTERLGGGSRAQHDLVEFTVLRACLMAGQDDELRRLLAARRPGPAVVAGLS